MTLLWVLLQYILFALLESQVVVFISKNGGEGRGSRQLLALAARQNPAHHTKPFHEGAQLQRVCVTKGSAYAPEQGEMKFKINSGSAFGCCAGGT